MANAQYASVVCPLRQTLGNGLALVDVHGNDSRGRHEQAPFAKIAREFSPSRAMRYQYTFSFIQSRSR